MEKIERRMDTGRGLKGHCDFCEKDRPEKEMIPTKYHGKTICKICWKDRYKLSKVREKVREVSKARCIQSDQILSRAMRERNKS